MKKSFHFFTLILLFSFTSLSATTHTWLGGSGSWVDAANWDTGTVPSFGDDVIIPSGKVGISNNDACQARSVDVLSGATLSISSGGSLEIIDAENQVGLINDGFVFIFGLLTIENITSPDNSHQGSAILNDASIYVFSTGILLIKDIDEIGIRNKNNFLNYGRISIRTVDGSSIQNSDDFYNFGKIVINASTVYPDYGIVNFNDFRNYEAGEIYIDGGGAAGFGNNDNNTGAHLRNYGHLEVENSALDGIYSTGIVTNSEEGYIKADQCDGTGLIIRPSSDFSNSGEIQIYHSQGRSLYAGGTCINEAGSTLHLLYAQGQNLKVPTGATFNNYGSVFTLKLVGNTDISLEGEYTNHDSGYTIIDDRISVTNGGTAINDGILVSSHDSGNHTIQGSSTFTNNGVIQDTYDAFPTATDNQQLIISQITGSMQVGVPFPNALDITSLSNVTIGSWSTNKTGTISAGTYDEVTNEFTPNSNAVGLSTIYVSAEIISSGNSRRCALNITGGILPFAENDPAQFFENQNQQIADAHPASSNSENLSFYPNPSSGFVQIESEAFKQSSELQVYNSLGQLVWSEVLEKGANKARLDFPQNFSNGIYYIQLSQQGNLISSKKINLQR